MTQQEIKEMNIFVKGLEREIELKKALEFALRYVCKGTEMGVFDDCAISGKLAIRRINAALEG